MITTFLLATVFAKQPSAAAPSPVASNPQPAREPLSAPVRLPIPIGVPKTVILDAAFADCGRNGYDYDRDPEEQADALNKLNLMMYDEPWSQLGYRQPDYGVGKPEEGSGLPGWAVNAVAMYLALRIAPSMALSLQPEQSAARSRAMFEMRARLATVPTVSLRNNTVLGSGSCRTYSALPDGSV